ncbi:hypothetical protein KQI84_19320 [bacterium]|nr:hypothetical protein [bacterium]
MFFAAIVKILIYEILVIALCVRLTRLTEAATRAPLLDILVSLLTWVPWFYAGAKWGWGGFWGCLVGQFIALQVFCIVHTKASGHEDGPKIRRVLDQVVGPVRNHIGLWLTIPALPVFLSIRLAEITTYQGLIWVLGFPRYRQAEWVNISRQKFEGLVGHDLVWCLYCDWMTGVYSLGAEMLRNVESFWCPIRFYSNKKCENCRLDFPDIDRWASPASKMADVTKLMAEKYPEGKNQPRSWWGHPERQNPDE